jgi:hypothetical protein
MGGKQTKGMMLIETEKKFFALGETKEIAENQLTNIIKNEIGDGRLKIKKKQKKKEKYISIFKKNYPIKYSYNEKLKLYNAEVYIQLKKEW